MRILPPPGSQRPVGPQPVPVFRSRVDLIQVDASVLDRDRRPVHGLTAKDFTVFEDGKPQQITAFTEMSASDPEDAPESWMRTVVPDVKMNNAEDGRVLLLILDDADVPPDPFSRPGGKPIGPNPKTAVKQVARAIVERLGPADLASMIFTVKNKNEQEFTSDRNRLFAAIEGFEPLPPNGYNRMRALDTLKDAAKFLAEIPQRRKAIILISPMAPAAIIPGSPVLINKTAGFTQDALVEAVRGNVTFYNINPLMMNGLDTEVEKLLDPSALPPDRAGASFGQPMSSLPPPATYTADVRALPLDQLTGGFSIRRPEQFRDGITQIFRETGSYYLLGYTNPTAKDDGKLRKIEVKVNRADLVVRSRTAYVPPKAKDANTLVSPNWKAISGLLPAKDIPMRINVSTFAIPGRKEVALAIAVGLREPLPLDATAPLPETVNLLTRVFSTNGDPKGQPQYTTAQLDLLPNPRGEVKYEVLSLLKLKPGRYHLRLSATSRAQGKSGSIYYDLEVPDYTKAPLSMSGVVISATPALTAGPQKVLSPVLPVVPTTQREFAGHRGSAYLRVYQGGTAPIAPVQMAIRILDTNEKAVLTRTDALAADQFDSNRAAEFRFELPIATLTPGTYLLTFEATMAGVSAPARQNVRFVVREAAAGIIER